uniref:Uncharacterized protein n=1 Tax=Populus davidiana TaxID=266767 RepID=A0A6M2F8F1_9ROSI
MSLHLKNCHKQEGNMPELDQIWTIAQKKEESPYITVVKIETILMTLDVSFAAKLSTVIVDYLISFPNIIASSSICMHVYPYYRLHKNYHLRCLNNAIFAL